MTEAGAGELYCRYRRFVQACLTSGAAQLWNEPLSAAEMRFLKQNLKLPHVLLAGCGRGRGLEWLLAAGAQVTALDREPAALECIQRHPAAAQVPRLCADLAELSTVLPPKSCDSILALGLVSGGMFLVQHNGQRALRHMRSVLRDRGVLLIDFLLAADEARSGGVDLFDFPIAEGVTVPGCCYRPSLSEAREELQRAGFRVRFETFEYDPQATRVGAVCTPAPTFAG